MTGLRLYKKEKLCGKIAIETLFEENSGARGALAYPLRCVWRENATRHADCPQFVVVVPKKRLRHAVDRVTMRRRIREAYRLNRHLIPMDRRIDLCFIFVAQKLKNYQSVEKAMARLLTSVSESFQPHEKEEPCE